MPRKTLSGQQSLTVPPFHPSNHSPACVSAVLRFGTCHTSCPILPSCLTPCSSPGAFQALCGRAGCHSVPTVLGSAPPHAIPLWQSGHTEQMQGTAEASSRAMLSRLGGATGPYWAVVCLTRNRFERGCTGSGTHWSSKRHSAVSQAGSSAGEAGTGRSLWVQLRVLSETLSLKTTITKISHWAHS